MYHARLYFHDDLSLSLTRDRVHAFLYPLLLPRFSSSLSGRPILLVLRGRIYVVVIVVVLSSAQGVIARGCDAFSARCKTRPPSTQPHSCTANISRAGGGEFSRCSETNNEGRPVGIFYTFSLTHTRSLLYLRNSALRGHCTVHGGYSTLCF